MSPAAGPARRADDRGASAALPDGLLVSVRSAAEADLAVSGGAAIVDAKEPTRGPLGPVDAEVAGGIAAAIGGRVPWTLACGELADGAGAVAERIHRTIAASTACAAGLPAAVKAGPAGLGVAEWIRQFAALRRRLPDTVEVVAVAYADWSVACAAEPVEIIAAAAAAGAPTILIDTFDKSGPGIVARVGAAAIAAWVATAAGRGLRVAIAGKVTADEIATVVAAGAAIVGVRSAACGGLRLGAIEIGQVRRLVGTLESSRRSPRRGHPGDARR